MCVMEGQRGEHPGGRGSRSRSQARKRRAAGSGIHGPRLVVVALLASLIGLVLAAPSATAAGEFEPNDDRESSFGPLAGGTDYKAMIETENDVDWYVFYVPSLAQLDISGVTLDGQYGTTISLYDGEGNDLNYIRVPGHDDQLPVEHLYRTLEPGRYYLRISPRSSLQTVYRFRIDPAPALTTSVACGEAVVGRDSLGPQLVATTESLAENAAALAVKAAAVHAAKTDRRQAGKQVKRLKKKVKRVGRNLKKFKKGHKNVKRFRKGRRLQGKLRRTRSKLSRTRAEARDARGQVEEAKVDRRPVWQEKLGLQGVAAQQQQALAFLQGQIAIHC